MSPEIPIEPLWVLSLATGARRCNNSQRTTGRTGQSGGAIASPRVIALSAAASHRTIRRANRPRRPASSPVFASQVSSRGARWTLQSAETYVRGETDHAASQLFLPVALVLLPYTPGAQHLLHSRQGVCVCASPPSIQAACGVVG
uniref:Uncharacterized protein n=1 Tax=Plectus sambesii TaxID=2011161 RepID=A0A914VT83_9BILA